MSEKWVMHNGGDMPKDAREFVDVDWLNGLMSQDLRSVHLDWELKFMWRNTRGYSTLPTHKHNG